MLVSAQSMVENFVLVLPESIKKLIELYFQSKQKKTSTGETIGDDRFSNSNATSVGGTYEVGGYSNTRLTFYGTHDAIHTNGYAVYTSTQY